MTPSERRPDPAQAPRGEVDDLDELVSAVLTASRALVGVSARSLTDVEETVTLTQFRCLVVLDGQGEINLNRLAALLEVTSSTAMRMIDRLLAAGLVTRRDNPDSRREVLLGLSDSGHSMVDQVTGARRAHIAKIVTSMPQGQRTGLVDALHAFADAAGEPRPEPDVTGRLIGW